MSQPSSVKKMPAASSTTTVLPFSYIREGAIIMKDGSLRSVLLASSINFYLKSETEQNAIISSYIGFLNTLSFPLQVVVQSRKLNIDAYLNNLKELEKKQPNELLRMQTADYRQFVKELLDLEEIMTKRFFVIVPYDPVGDRGRNFMQRLSAIFTASTAVTLREEKFRKYNEELQKRVALVQSGLSQMSITTVPLDTAGLIELLYKTYNQEIADIQPLTDVNKLEVE